MKNRKNSIRAVDKTVQKTHIWLHQIRDLAPDLNEQEAYAVLRSVLQTLRAHMTLIETADFASQLPTLLRGVFYDGWRPLAPKKHSKHKQGFIDEVKNRIAKDNLSFDLERSVHATLEMLSKNISEGEIKDIIAGLPKELRDLFSINGHPSFDPDSNVTSTYTI